MMVLPTACEMILRRIREAGGEAIMAIELDEKPEAFLLTTLKMFPAVTDVTLLNQI